MCRPARAQAYRRARRRDPDPTQPQAQAQNTKLVMDSDDSEDELRWMTLEETRRNAEEYLQAVGFPHAAASRLAQRLQKPVGAESIPEACSDLIDKHGGDASPGRVEPAVPSASAPAAAPLGEARQPPTPQQLATDVAEQVSALMDGHASLKPRLEAATTSKGLAVEMRAHPGFDAAVDEAAKRLEQRYVHNGLPPTRSIMAEAYEVLVADRRVTAVDRTTNIKVAKVETFFAGVILSRIQPADTPSTLLLPSGRQGGGMPGKNAAVYSAPAPGDRLAAKLRSRSVDGSGGFGAASLTDFESDLAHALALSQEEARGGPSGDTGAGIAGAERQIAVGRPGGSVRTATLGEDYELQAALAASVSAVGGGNTTQSEDDQVAAALAASLGSPGITSAGGAVIGGNDSSVADGTEDDQLARALALSMGEHPAGVEPATEPQCGAAVAELMSWGFDKARVLQALEASGGDQQGAANILLG